MVDTVAVVIPSIPTRPQMLANAVGSVLSQTRYPDELVIRIDRDHDGAARTRTAAMHSVDSDWIAFLDDDDIFYADHLQTLMDTAAETGADVIYTGCAVFDAHDVRILPLHEEWGRFGRPFDANLLCQQSYIPVTSLVRRKVITRSRAKFYTTADIGYDDWLFYLSLLDAGATFYHKPAITWRWNHWGGNTSGRGDRW